MSANTIPISKLRSVIEDFLDELASTVTDSHKVERVLAGKETLTISDLSNQPEEWTEDNLIWPFIKAVGLNRESGRPASQRSAAGTTQREAPDFRLVEQGGEFVVIGENKSPNNIDQAEHELVDDYLSNKAWPDFGIATDGFEWVIYRAEHGGDFLEFNEVERVDLRPAINAVARDLGHVGSAELSDTDVAGILNSFRDTFTPDNLHTLLTQTAPKEFRDTRDANIEEFYELYIELLFGESDEHDYDTCLRDDIRSPPEATDKDEDLFAVTLMNRLLFIKFLETRNVLPDRFLRSLVRDYEDNKDSIPGTLYETHIKPLFYELFNTQEENRHPKLRTGKYSDVPYLNGGLFRENFPKESRYNLLDRTLPMIINDLIEGHRLELNGRSFDPAILGSVFEKTINYIGEEEGRQKEIGAYYTPNDVTRHISERTIDPKVKRILTEAFIGHSDEDHEEYVRNQIEQSDLSEILRYIEDGVAMYGANPDALEDVLDRLNDLTILDPACGSGHFLTTAMEEIHQVQLSIMRGLNGGEDPDRVERYDAKQELALNAIYGVDVDEVAVEIAKLRIWLKIVEGNSWEEEYGRLPNIDVNIVAGNSLVGFPVRGNVQTQLGAIDDRLPDLAEKRRAYKFENEGSRRDIMKLEGDIREDRDEKYLKNLTYTVETEVKDTDTFNKLVESIPEGEFYPTVQSVKVQRWDEDGETVALTDDNKETLGEVGFEWDEWRDQNKSATLDVEERLEDSTMGELIEQEAIIEDLRGIFEAGFEFSDVERQPTPYDLDNITGTPLHWDIEFPELLPLEDTNGIHPDISFDIIVGNPPYGNILNPSEKTFIDPYRTDSINDVSTQFVERQIQLLDNEGYYGNVTTARLVYQGSMGDLHDLLKTQLANTKIACFGFRPSRVFSNAHVRVALITANKDAANDDENPLLTSDFIVFTEENREDKFKNVSYEQTEGLALGREKIGDNESSYNVLPKVGSPVKHSILETLKDNCDTTMGDIFIRDEPNSEGYKIFKQRGGLHWINPMIENLRPDSSGVLPFYFTDEYERDLSFLVYNSSLYYMYWLTYSNQHNQDWPHFTAFPYPGDIDRDEHEDDVHELARQLWDEMESRFDYDQEKFEESAMRELKPIINTFDKKLADSFGLSDKELEYVTNYLTDWDGGRLTLEPTVDPVDQFD